MNRLIEGFQFAWKLGYALFWYLYYSTAGTITLDIEGYRKSHNQSKGKTTGNALQRKTNAIAQN